NIEKIEIWQKEGKGLGKKIGRSKVEGSALIAAIRPQVENEVSAQAGALISGGEDAWEQAAREYRPMMAAIAKSLSPGYTTAAVERRKQIANVKPNMGPNTKASKKSGRKKGGDK
ncbi:MAG: hypothetical protein NTW99_01360, partial [Chloroflexi bacterium]|nr:hypothetical protein [Chloroflexota bacterium]